MNSGLKWLQIKTLSPLRSSDRRKTADKIIADFKLESSAGTSVDPEAKAAATAAHTSLRNALLPDNALSAKFTTTSGPSLKEVSGTVYIGSHVSGEQRVLWFSLDGQLYPTGRFLLQLCTFSTLLTLQSIHSVAKFGHTATFTHSIHGCK